jgi:AraC family transcriptional regulator
MADFHTTDPQKDFLRQEYIGRINKVIDYIDSNLDKELKLETLADVANFSRYHFHRIFSSMVGEPLGRFINRIRCERAAIALIGDRKKSVTEIAFDFGFSSSATFARAFKEEFQMSASDWRNLSSEQLYKISKNRKMKSKDGEVQDEQGNYIAYINFRNNNRRIAMLKNKAIVEVKELEELNVAYVRHIGPYKGDGALFERLFTKLMTWAGPRGLINFPESKMISVYHDDPEITEESKQRTSICLSVPEGTKVDGEVGNMKVPGGKFAVGHFELSTDEYEEAWKHMVVDWLPESGYQFDDRLCYELYLNDPKQHPEGKCITDICIPIRPL